jgi:hypothetical protein
MHRNESPLPRYTKLRLSQKTAKANTPAASPNISLPKFVATAMAEEEEEDAAAPPLPPPVVVGPPPPPVAPEEEETALEDDVLGGRLCGTGEEDTLPV